ncbi:putative oxidoreductase [Amylocarpus encephaloides]|uniref:Oxidoreductase n=1 Tax=Amylocarpus encephaloides TaxID=45428 RepID=A0A9P8CAS0_9HELO|nr:putative oxidoreductase [Amylocarpus encephaloides]
MSPKNILVLGLGELGLQIVTSLAKSKPSSTSLTVLLRPSTLNSPPASKQAELSSLASLSVKFLPGDVVHTPESDLPILFGPFDLIICALGFASPSGGLQLKISRAVIAAGVETYYPWQFGVDYELVGRGSAQPVWDEQLDVRELLGGQSKTKWVIVSTGLFTSFLFEEFFGVVVKDDGGKGVKVRALGDWGNGVCVTTPEDIGRLTASVVFDGEERGKGGEVVYTAGDSITYEGLADLLEKEMGGEVERVLWTVEHLQKELNEDPENTVMKYRVAFAVGKGVRWPMEQTYNYQKSIKTVDVKEYIQSRVKAKLV